LFDRETAGLLLEIKRQELELQARSAVYSQSQ